MMVAIGGLIVPSVAASYTVIAERERRTIELLVALPVSVGDILVEMITGLQSSFTYTGARRWHEFHEKAVVGVQTAAGFYEGTPHGGNR